MNKARLASIAVCLLPLMATVGCSHREEIARLGAECTQAEARGDLQTALARCDSMLKLDAKNGWGLIVRANIHEQLGQWQAAIDDYSAYLKLPTNAPPQAGFLSRFDILQPRRSQFESFRKDPSFIYSRRAYAYAKAGAFDNAVMDAIQAVILEPSNATLHETLAEVYQMKGDPKSALEAFNAAVKAAPKNPEGYLTLGDFYSKRGEFAAAITNLDEAIRLQPQNSHALLARSIAFLRHGEFEKSLADLDDAIQLDPEEAEFYAVRGTTLLQTDRFQEALSDFNHCLSLRPNNAAALANRGRALIRKGSIEAGLEDLNHAIQINSGEPLFYAWRGRALGSTNRFEEALKDLDRAIALGPHSEEAFATRGWVYSRKEDFAKALADFKTARELNPGAPGALNSIAWLMATCPDSSYRNGKEALDLSLKACDQTSYKFYFLVDTLAASYAETGDFDRAIKYQKDCVAMMSPTNKEFAAAQERLALYQDHKPYRQKNQQSQ